MATTSLLVELLVVGVVASVWLYPLAAGVLPGIGIQATAGDQAAIWVMAAAMIYALGALVNFLSDRLLFPITRHISNQFGGNDDMQAMRARLLMQGSEKAVEYLLQRRSLVRLFRANTLSGIAFLVIYGFDVADARTKVGLSVVSSCVIGIGFSLLFLWAFARTLRGYYALLQDMVGIARD